jgi:hypothetical protein
MRNKFLLFLLSIVAVFLVVAVIYLLAGIMVEFPAPFLITMGFALFAALLLPLIGHLYCTKRN